MILGPRWTLEGSDGEAIHGETDTPRGDARACALLIHGFKGYKEYGLIPVLGHALAGAGVVAHRVTLSHSGMTESLGRFERPDLFERDTWNRQVHDVRVVIEAVRSADPAGRGLPLYLIGHSRGGVTAVLTGGRHAEALRPDLAGVVTLNAPDTCCSLDEQERRRLLEDGSLDVLSTRTGQTLRVGSPWLTEQIADPERHDPVAMAARLPCRLLVVQALDDQTVPPSGARRLAQAAGSGAELVEIPDADHGFNTPNPADVGMPPSAPLERAIDSVCIMIGKPSGRVAHLSQSPCSGG